MDSYLGNRCYANIRGRTSDMIPEAFKHKEKSMAIAAALWPLVQQAIAAERERCEGGGWTGI